MPTDPAATSLRIPVPRLEQFCVAALRQVGVRETEARTTTDVLVTTDTFGVFTHGTRNLRGYVRRLRAGGLRPGAQPTVVAEGPAWALVDGQSGLGMVTSAFAMDVAIQKARATGVGYAGVRNSCHFGAAGYYALRAAHAGLIGLAVSNDKPSVTVPGSRARVLGSNPLAYAVPAGQHRPIFLDIATSAVAGVKVYQAQTHGGAIPSGWLVDAQGLPTTDPAGFPDSKTLLPMAGHKGYGLALLIEILAGALTGAAVAQEVRSWIFDDPALPTGHGAAFAAFDVGALLPLDDFQRRVDRLIDDIHRAPLAQDARRIYVPGEREWEHRDQALVEGLNLPSEAAVSLRGLAEDLESAPLARLLDAPLASEKTGSPEGGRGQESAAT